MGKPTGFLDYERKVSADVDPKQRIKNFNEFHGHLSLEEQQLQGARCMDCGVPFCQSGMTLCGMTSGCPLHNLVPEWNDLVYTGNWEQAYNRLHKTNNFPEFTARVCPALCEAACTCNLTGDPVATRENEYAIIENAYEKGYAAARPPKTRTGKTVAVVGSGPAGLTVADQLNKRGHLVTVFERSDRIGGLLMYGIPNMKLDKKVVERKIKVMEEEGIRFVPNADIGKNVKADMLLKEFDRVVLACGSADPRDINVPGRDADGIYFAVDFLGRNTKSLLDSGFKDKKYVDTKDRHVIIIGGSVTQIEMMPKAPDERAQNNPWPEWPKICKTDYGQEEAAAVYGHDPRIYESTVKEFIKDKSGKLKGVKTVRLVLDADIVLIAAGFLGAQKYVTDAFQVEVDQRANVKTASGSFQTSVENVFTAGDMHTGQSLVVKAIRQGRECAREVDGSLMGYTNLYIQ